MTTTEHTAPPPGDLAEQQVAAAAGEIADRLRTKSVDQVIAIGERTGWWTAELVDWVVDGGHGPVPVGDSTWHLEQQRQAAEQERLDQLQDQLTDAGVVHVDQHVDVDESHTDVPSAVEQSAAEPETLTTAASEMSDGAAEAIADLAVSDLVARGQLPDPNDDGLPTVGSAYIGVLQARDLAIDRDYQRPLDEPRVKRMVDTWDPRMLGTIDVSDRGPGSTPFRYVVVNGQHRVHAAVQVSPAGADVWLPCTIHEGLDVAAEARLMHELDRTTKKLTGWDRWRTRRAAGDGLVLAVDRVAARHGLTVTDAMEPGTMRSYGAAEKLLQRGGEELLDSVLGVLHGAYGDDPAGYQAPLLSGVGRLLQVYGTSVDIPRLTRALTAVRPEQLRARATALRDSDGGPLNELMTRVVLGQYNRTPGPRLGGRA